MSNHLRPRIGRAQLTRCAQAAASAAACPAHWLASPRARRTAGERRRAFRARDVAWLLMRDLGATLAEAGGFYGVTAGAVAGAEAARPGLAAALAAARAQMPAAFPGGPGR